MATAKVTPGAGLLERGRDGSRNAKAEVHHSFHKFFSQILCWHSFFASLSSALHRQVGCR